MPFSRKEAKTNLFVPEGELEMRLGDDGEFKELLPVVQLELEKPKRLPSLIQKLAEVQTGLDAEAKATLEVLFETIQKYLPLYEESQAAKREIDKLDKRTTFIFIAPLLFAIIFGLRTDSIFSAFIAWWGLFWLLRLSYMTYYLMLCDELHLQEAKKTPLTTYEKTMKEKIKSLSSRIEQLSQEIEILFSFLGFDDTQEYGEGKNLAFAGRIIVEYCQNKEKEEEIIAEKERIETKLRGKIDNTLSWL